jgi:hypothetical protein
VGGMTASRQGRRRGQPPSRVHPTHSRLGRSQVVGSKCGGWRLRGEGWKVKGSEITDEVDADANINTRPSRHHGKRTFRRMVWESRAEG